jgi:hypothetical protein
MPRRIIQSNLTFSHAPAASNEITDNNSRSSQKKRAITSEGGHINVESAFTSKGANALTKYRHVLTCGLIDTSLHTAVSWDKLRKLMDQWHLPQDFWMTIEKGVNLYTEQPHKPTTQSKENEPQKPFGVTFNKPRNLLQQAFTTQSHIGWDTFLKGQISRDWVTYVRHKEENSKGHGKSQDWSANFIGGLWEHLK